MDEKKQDLWAGSTLLLIGMGASFYSITQYEVGTPARMGPGFFPAIIGSILALLGISIALIAIKELRSGSTQNSRQIHAHETPNSRSPTATIRPFLAVVASISVFSLSIDSLGLIPATVLLTLCAALAERPMKIARSIFLAAGLSILSWLIFVWGLEMPIPAIALR